MTLKHPVGQVGVPAAQLRSAGRPACPRRVAVGRRVTPLFLPLQSQEPILEALHQIPNRKIQPSCAQDALDHESFLEFIGKECLV